MLEVEKNSVRFATRLEDFVKGDDDGSTGDGDGGGFAGDLGADR